MSCTFNYKGFDYTEREIKDILEQEHLTDQASNALTEFSTNTRLENRTAKIAKQFGLFQLADGRYIGSNRKLQAILSWSNQLEAKGQEPVIVSYEKYPDREQQHFVINITDRASRIAADQYVNPSIAKMREKDAEDEQTVRGVLDRMSTVFRGLKYEFIEPSDLNQAEHNVNVARVNAFIRGGVVYMVRGRVNQNTALEEALHPFVNNLYSENRALFDQLLRTGKQLDPKLFADIVRVYGTGTAYTPVDINQEFVTQMLQRAMRAEIDMFPNKRAENNFRTLMQQFFQWVEQMLTDLVRFINSSGNRVVELELLPEEMNYADLARLLNTEKVEVYLNFNDTTTRYSQDELRQAEEMMKSQPDERFHRSATKFKLDRIKQQEEILRAAAVRPRVRENTAQQETIAKFIDNNTVMLREFYENNLQREMQGKLPFPSISVSAFIGSTEFTSTEDYSMFKNFGIFMHALLEETQERATKEGKRLRDIMTREMFDEVLAAQQAKEPFEITNLTEEMLYEMGQEIIDLLGAHGSTGNIILPELTIAGKNKEGQMIVGRMDLAVIDVTGQVHIVDFKTKKVSSLVQTKDGVSDMNMNRVYRELATKTTTVNTARGTASDFQNITRSVYDTWNTQLLAYEYLLRQHEIPVGKSEIIGLIYQADQEKRFQGYQVAKFENNFYDYAASVSRKDQKVGTDFSEIGLKKYEEIKEKIKSNIPVSSQQSEDSDASQERYAFNTTEAEYKMLVSQLKTAVDRDINDVIARMKALRNQPENAEELDSLGQRLTTLKSFASTIENTDIESSLKLKLVLESLDADIDKLFANWQKVFGLDASTIRSRQVGTMHALANNMRAIVDVLRDQMNDAVQKKLNGLTVNTPAYLMLQDIDGKLVSMEADYRKFAVEVFVRMIQQAVPEATFKNVSAEMREALQPRIDKLKERLAAMQRGEASTFWEKMKLKYVSLLDKDRLAQMQEQLDPSQRRTLDAMGALELEILRLEAMRDTGKEFDTETLRQYVMAVTDPQSHMYVGKSNPSLLNILNTTPDQFIASASNSDLGISAFAMFMKNAQAVAQRDFINDMEASDLETLRENFGKGRTTEQMNDAVSEMRTIQNVDSKTGEVTEQKVQMFNKPTSEAYDNKFRVYRQTYRYLSDQIAEARRERGLVANDNVKHAAAKKKVADLVSQRERMVKEHTAWMIQNASLKFVDKYYELMNLMPAELAGEIEQLMMEREAIMDAAGFGNEEMLTEEDFEMLEQINLSIKKLRHEAGKQDPRYQEYLDAMNDLYDVETNTARFERVYNNKKLEYANDPAKLKRWEELNMVTVPTAAYYADLDAIYSRMEELTGGNARMKALFERRRDIMRPYRKEGAMFDPRYLSAEDREALQDIEDAINEYKRSTKSVHLIDIVGPENIGEYRMLSRALRDVSKKQLNRFYVKEKEEREKKLMSFKGIVEKARIEMEDADRSGEAPRIDAAVNNLLAVEQQFVHIEQEFEQWFKENHTGEYTSVMSQPVIDYSSIRPYLFERVPNDPQYLETKPSSKWTVRRLSEAAYNPDYAELADGTPLPKGMKMVDGVVEIGPGVNPANVSDKYVGMTRDKAAFAFYNKFMEIYLGQQKKIHGKALGYKVPGAQATTIQNFIRKGFVNGMKGEIAQMKDKFFRMRQSETDKLTNFYGDSDSIRMRFNDQYSEDMQTADAINAGMKWMYESYINIAMGETQPVADHVLNVMRSQLSDLVNRKSNSAVDRQRIKDLQNTINLLQNERDKFIKGQFSDGEHRRAKKVINGVLAISSFGRLGFDVAAQLKNYVSGNVQAFLAADDSAHYGMSDLRWAKSQIYGYNGFFRQYLADWGKVGNLSVQTKLYRMFNPAQKDYTKYLNNTTGSTGRRLAEKVSSIQELAYALQDKGDTEVSMTVWLAMMNSYKYKKIDSFDAQGNPVYEMDADGNPVLVSAYDAYTQDSEGRVIRRTDVEFTEQDEQRLRNIIYSEIRRAQGNYAKSDMPDIERGIVGQLANFFRKYLVPQALNRLGGIRPNWEGEEAAMGYWRALFSMWNLYGPKEFAKHALLGGFAKGYIKNTEVNAFYSTRAAQASRELLVGLLLTSVSLLLTSYVKRKKEDDEELAMVEGNLIRLIWGVKSETTSLMPVPGIGSFDEYSRNISQITGLVNDATKLYRTGEHLAAMGIIYAYDFETPDLEEDPFFHAIYTRNVYQKRVGPFEKETPKLYKDLYDLTGYRNIDSFFDPDYRLSMMQKSQ